MECEGETCRWCPPGTLRHDLDKLGEAMREVARQVVIAVKRDRDILLRALGWGKEGVSDGNT